MPVYEYRCPKCRLVFELKRPVCDFDKPTNCPKCGVISRKIISGFASKAGHYLRPPEIPVFRK